MPANNIVTNKYGISMVAVSGGLYKLLTSAESSGPSIATISVSLDQDLESTNSSSAFAPYITNENLVQNNFSAGQKFCYTLYDGNTHEVGFGEIVNSGAATILDRQAHVYYFDGTNKIKLTSPFDFSSSILFLQVSPPPSLEDSLVYENSVLGTSSSGIPTVVPLQNNTVLGCKSNYLQSIDGEELVEMFGNNITGALNGQNVSCAALNLYSIRLLPSGRPINPPRGTIIYNDQSNIIEFYNGNSWSAL